MKFHNHHIIGIYFTLAFACYNDNAIKSFLELKNIIYKETECKRLSILPPLVFDLLVLLYTEIRHMINVKCFAHTSDKNIYLYPTLYFTLPLKAFF